MTEAYLSNAMNAYGPTVYRLTLCRMQNIADADIHGSPSFAIKSILYYTTGEKFLQ